MLHAEYDHEPGEPNIYTVCGEPGSSDNSQVSCWECILILQERGWLHMVRLDYLLLIPGHTRRHKGIYRRVETVPVNRELL